METQSHQYPNNNTSHNHIRSYGGRGSTSTTTTEMERQASQHHSGNARPGGELPALDCNLNSLCDHIQIEGFNHGSFSDVIVQAMGATYHLHRLILSRSSYFRNMLHGPWKDATAPVLTLHVDDNNVNTEAIAIALAYLYGYHPKLDDSNAFRVLAAASFLDLQDLCVICTDFIISELWTTNFLEYQVFAEGQDYGIHGERVRNACWGYLCQSGAMELKEVLPKLSVQTLHALLTSDELWVPSEEKRFELALYTLLKKVAFSKTQPLEQVDLSKANGKSLISGINSQITSSELAGVSSKDKEEGHDTAQTILVELADRVVDSQQESGCNQSNIESKCQCTTKQITPVPSANENSYSSSYQDMPAGCDMAAMEGPSEEGTCYQLNNNSWLGAAQTSGDGMSCNDDVSNEWGRCGMPMSWGGRLVGRRVKTCAKWICGLNSDEYDTFVNIFEGGSLLYCNMTFEALLNVRKQLEEFGFPCKSVNDGLWLQTLLSQRVHEIGADTCKNCCLVSLACQCRPQYGFARTGYYMQDQEPNSATTGIGDVYFTDSSQGEVNGPFRPVRVHVRGPIDGLAGIGRGSTYVPATAWPPTRFVFSRVPFHMGNRNCQQSLGNDDSENRADHNGEHGGNGLTALVGLSQGTSNTDDGDVSGRLAGCSIAGPSSGGGPVQMMESSGNDTGVEWDNDSSSIALDVKTPLSHFPPFRFAVEFKEVHRLNDGQVKHSPEYFYAGSLWKVSVQAFNDEDPQGRRTLGFFLHRRKAEIPESLRKVHMYVDAREKVTARYQLICPSKREVMVFGSFKQPGTLLPKAPKGWGWRTALLFDELGELLQNGALRIAAVVQLI